MMAKKKPISGNCEVMVWSNDRAMHRYQCQNKAKYIEGGKKVCGVHCKAAKKKREDKTNAKWVEKEKVWDRQSALSKLADGIETKDLKNYKLVRKKK